MGNRVIEGLKANTSYNFYVRAKNIFGKWGALSAVANKTTAQDTTAPSAPTGQGILITNPNFFILRWTVATEKDVEGYNIYIYTSNTPASAKIIKRVGYSTTRVIVNQGEATEDASITVAASTTYYFWITAVDKSGNESAKSTVVSGALSVVGSGFASTVVTEEAFDQGEAVGVSTLIARGDHTHGTPPAPLPRIICAGDEVVCNNNEVVWV